MRIMYWSSDVCSSDLYGTVPVIAGQHDQRLEMVHGFGRDREVGCTFGRHLCDLRRRALMQVQADVFIALAESVNDRRQRVAGLRMRGGNRQITAVGVVELVGNAPDVLDLTAPADRTRGVEGKSVAVRIDIG